MSQLSRITTWATGQILKASDLNSEFNNIVNAWNNIDTASASWTSLSVSGNVSVGGTLSVTGNVITTVIFNPGSNQAVRLSKGTFTAAGGVVEMARPGDGSYVGVLGLGADTNDDLALNNSSGSSFLRLGANSTIGFYIGETNANMLASTRPTTTLYAKVTTAGLTFSNSAGIVGSATNDAATAGNVGEEIQAIVSSFGNTAATATWGDITSISLTAGDWLVHGTILLQINGATLNGVTQGAVSIYTGATTTDHVFGSNVVEIGSPVANSANGGTVIYRVSVASTTTVYVKALATFSAGNPRAAGSIKAWRVR